MSQSVAAQLIITVHLVSNSVRKSPSIDVDIGDIIQAAENGRNYLYTLQACAYYVCLRGCVPLRV
jgi:low affinity Fe/Cu permease